MPYYPELDLIFIHIPKTAGGAIEDLLLPYKAAGRKTLGRRLAAKLALPQDARAAYIPGHATAAWHRRVMGAAVFDAARRFAVVRNPYDRLISSYEFIRQNPLHHRHKRTAGQGFTEFLNARQMSQMPFLLDRDGRMLVDHIVRFEALAGELAALFDRLGIPLALPAHGNRNSSAKKDRSHYLTPEALGLINRACAEDFRRLGYAMQTAPL
ncbi:sulfotransferase family 2 domain-containing protein [Paragemmobacter straminiformis]|uniref:Sulfotransferase family 2 domain-containing protein n=1 Tax=Paragemmobacter straminiformis TaxID=2045119 RepID=A0A842I5A9_9RHOB|nr:sulfotransferase family 2 domain-containing protein [Gemmobacter straminiformis]MBC2834809.1 sulfotransferase family 2 domain-containing protein [Gemmobacter straminiformis]